MPTSMPIDKSINPITITITIRKKRDAIIVVAIYLPRVNIAILINNLKISKLNKIQHNLNLIAQIE